MTIEKALRLVEKYKYLLAGVIAAVVVISSKSNTIVTNSVKISMGRDDQEEIMCRAEEDHIPLHDMEDPPIDIPELRYEKKSNRKTTPPEPTPLRNEEAEETLAYYARD